MTKATTLEFAPGCFDNFEGTQEELNELMAEIQKMFDSGEMEANAIKLDIEELMDEDPEMAEQLLNNLNNTASDTRNLQ